MSPPAGAVPDTLGSYAKFRGRHYLTDQDYTRDELLELLRLAADLKALWRRRTLTPFLAGKTLAMIFEHPSTRTRISFEAGMSELGGHAQYLRPGEIPLGGHETVADTARAWRRILATVRTYADLEPALLASVEELIDFVTAPEH